MIHDLLFALQGVSGDVFQVVPLHSSSNPEFKWEFKAQSLHKLPWIAGAEYDASINLIQTLGCPFRSMREWSKHILTAGTVGNASSLYLEQIAHTLRDLMQEYVADLSKLERQFVSTVVAEPEAVLAKNHPFSEFRLRLSRWKAFMGSVVGFIAGLERCCDNPSFARVYGYLESYLVLEIGTSTNFYHRIHNGVMALFGRQLGSWLSVGSVYDPHREFFLSNDGCLISDTLPVDILSESLAEDILITGLLLCAIGSCRSVDGDDAGACDNVDKQLIESVQSALAASQPMEMLYQVVVQRSINVMESYRRVVDETLHLSDQLALIRDIVLFGDSSLMDSFVRCTINIRETKGNVGAEDMRYALWVASGDRRWEDNTEHLLSRIHFSVTSESPVGSLVGVSYDVSLHSPPAEEELRKWILSNDDLKHLSRFFNVLLAIKELQIRLSSLWKTPELRTGSREIARLFQQLFDVTGTLWAFFQTEVVERWFKLSFDCSAIEELDLKESWIYRQSLLHMFDASLLNVKAVKDAIFELVVVGGKFISLMEHIRDGESSADQSVKKLQTKLDQCIQFIVRSGNTISELKVQTEISSLSRLAVKLDFNGYTTSLES